VSKYHLHIEPYEGRFAIYDHDSLMAIGSRFRAEETVRIWQAEIDAGQQPSMSLGVKLKVMNADVVALHAESERSRAESERWRAEFETWRTERDPSTTGRDGATARQDISPEPAWHARVEDEVVKEFGSDRLASDKEIILWIQSRWDSWIKRGWEEGRGKRGSKRSSLAAFVKSLREAKKLPPNPRARG
jgi:hypothetical protein